MGKIRRAAPEEAERISEMMMRSKAYWGYPDNWMAKFRLQLGITPQDIRENEVYIEESDGQLLGMYHLILKGEAACLDALFVAPEAIGTGCGKCLIHHAIKQSRDAGYNTMSVESDPHAEGFYVKMGAVKVGEHASSIPGAFPAHHAHRPDTHKTGSLDGIRPKSVNQQYCSNCEDFL